MTTATLTKENLDFLRAFIECSSEIQILVTDLIREVSSDDCTEDELHMAMASIADALFPNPYKGQHGMDLLESEVDAAANESQLATIVSEMDQEESTFAARLRTVMDSRGLTQCELAAKVGLGQPAISNFLNRECRPQRRTVEKLAAALEVAPQELWPAFSN